MLVVVTSIDSIVNFLVSHGVDEVDQFNTTMIKMTAAVEVIEQNLIQITIEHSNNYLSICQIFLSFSKKRTTGLSLIYNIRGFPEL